MRAVAWLTLLILLPRIAEGQTGSTSGGTVQDAFRRLFTFAGQGVCDPGVLFCLTNSSGKSAAQAFATNANAAAQELTLFVRSSITQGIANVPTPSTSSGTLFRLSALGVPVRNTEKSTGPIFGERAPTLGRGKLLVGANSTSLNLTELRGTKLDDISFSIVQRNLPPYDKLGDPALERTYLQVTTHIGLDARSTNFFLTYGLLDRIDLGVSVPLVEVALSGYSDARIVLAPGSDPAAGFSFGGPPEDPKLVERSVVNRTYSKGLGDVSARMKLRLTGRDASVGAALLTDVRFATGKTENFVGAGETWAKSLFVSSFDVGGGFTPHLNVGYFYRPGEGYRDAALANGGFDQRITRWLTFATDVLSQVPLGTEPLQTSSITISGIDTPVLTSNIPASRDRIFDGAVGAKLRIRDLTAIGNALIPLNTGGLRGKVLWTGGVQLSF
jgi:hypothetical protein